jgi:hypothetical protein
VTDETTTETGEDIYSLLELCTTDELAPIVDALTNAPVSFLKLTRAFEQHQPDHVRYTDQIGDETYRLGLLARGKGADTRPTYQAMIAALCKQIGFAESACSDALLLNAFTKQHLFSAPPADRDRLVAEASNAAASAASGVFSSDAWPTLASVLVWLAYLRRKLGEDGRLASPCPSPAASVPSETLITDPAQAKGLSIRMRGDELVLAPMASLSQKGWRSLGESPKLSGALAPILEGIQSLIAANQTLRSDELLRRLPDGVKGTAHIVEPGTKGMKGLETIAVSRLMGPVAIMMLAGAVAEQRKLEAIEKSLAEIKTAIADLSRFQQGKRRSVLTGSIRYFQQVAPSVLAGELASEVLQEIERHEVDLVRVQEHLTEELRERIADLRAIKKETFGSSKYLKALRAVQANLDAKYDELLLCLRARACGYQLLCTFPGREAGKATRLADITRVIDTLSLMGEPTMTMDTVLREKLAAISSFETKSLILKSENLLLDRIAGAHGEILEGLRSDRSDTLSASEPISIDFHIEEGRPVAMRLV